MEGADRPPDEGGDRVVVPKEQGNRQLIVVAQRDRVAGHVPRRRLDPDPALAAVGNPPPLHVLCRTGGTEPETEQVPQKGGASPRRLLLEHDTSPLLSGVLRPVWCLGDARVDVISVIHCA